MSAINVARLWADFKKFESEAQKERDEMLDQVYLKELNVMKPLDKADAIVKELQVNQFIEKISSSGFDNLSEIEQGKAFRAMQETGRLWPKGEGGVRRGSAKRGKRGKKR